jgi:hypothetical protein
MTADTGGRSLAGRVGLNSAGDMEICLLWVLCVVYATAYLSSRGVLPRASACACPWGAKITFYTSVYQSLWDRGPVNNFFIRRGPGAQQIHS